MTSDLAPSANTVVPSAGFPGPGALRRSWVYFTVPAGLKGRTIGQQGRAGQGRTYDRVLLGMKHCFEIRDRRTEVEDL